MDNAPDFLETVNTILSLLNVRICRTAHGFQPQRKCADDSWENLSAASTVDAALITATANNFAESTGYLNAVLDAAALFIPPTTPPPHEPK